LLIFPRFSISICAEENIILSKDKVLLYLFFSSHFKLYISPLFWNGYIVEKGGKGRVSKIEYLFLNEKLSLFENGNFFF
jgi:hypothetical protein